MSFSKNTPFSKQDAAIAYALIERAVPFPCDALAQSAPLQYKFSQALGRATSVHPGCSHAHLSALASSRLNAVKMNYSDLLGIFPNLMFIFTGASGDGKSIPVWLDTMVMHMYRKKEFQLAMDLHKTQVTAFSLAEQDEAAPPMVEPQKPKEVDELYDAGSTVGLGQMMKATSGRAVWLKHEARKLLKKLMEGTTIGSFDEINQIAEHAYYRNSPANDNSKFSIENPHLVVLWLMHIEELIPHFQTKVGKDDDDSVAGLMRFFIAHFPAVVNKLLPEGPPAELNKLIESDAYFNKLNFDEVATANVNILSIFSRLYKEQCQRPDEVDHPERYSWLLGLHSLSFEPDAWRAYVGDFNACSDKVLHAHTKIKTRADASKLSKDKTKLLQFVPTVDLLEKVIRFLLPATLTDPQIEALSPEELLKHVADAKIDDILEGFRPDRISGNVTRRAVEAGRHLATFYTKQYKMHEDMLQQMEAFRAERKDLCMLPNPRPAVIFGLQADVDVRLPGRLGYRYLQLLEDGFTWADYVMDPVLSKQEIKQARYEVSCLALTGLVRTSTTKVIVVIFDAADETIAQRLSVLQLMDATVDLQELSNSVPKGTPNIDFTWSLARAEPLAKLVKRALTEDVSTEDVKVCPDSYEHPVGQSQAAVAEGLGQQDEFINQERRGKRLKTTEVELSIEQIQKYISQVTQILKTALLSLRSELPGHEFVKKFSSINLADRHTSVVVAFKLLEVLGLGRRGARGGTLTMLRPTSNEDVEREADRLSGALRMDRAKVKERLLTRSINQAYDPRSADAWYDCAAPCVEQHLQEVDARVAVNPAPSAAVEVDVALVAEAGEVALGEPVIAH